VGSRGLGSFSCNQLLPTPAFPKPAAMGGHADERYMNFSDNTMKDRLAANAATLAMLNPKSKRSSSTPAGGKKDSNGLDPSGRCDGWDKYYFFSVPGAPVVTTAKVGADPPLKLPTANMGRSRPAVHGPQTFGIETFSKEVIQRERGRIEKRGARTNYTELFSQLPRSATATLGLPTYEGQKFEVNERNGPSPGQIMQTASESMLQPPPKDMVHAAGQQPRKRMGPYWPPPTAERPTSESTRKALFPGGHRTNVDLYSADRSASRGMGYAVFVG